MRAIRFGIFIAVNTSAVPGVMAQTLVLTPVESIYDAGAAGPLSAPEGVGCSDGSVVVADTANSRLVRFEQTGGVVRNARVIKLRQLGYPVRVVLRPNGAIVALDRKSGNLLQVNERGRFAGAWRLSDAAGRRTVVARAFALDARGDFYVLDGATGEVLHTDESGKLLQTIAPPAGSGIMADITVDRAGNVYGVTNVERGLWVAKKGAARFEPMVSDVAKHLAFGTSMLFEPRLSSLLIVDQNQHTLLSVGPNGAYRGRALRLGWREGMLRYPGQVCTTKTGELFIADRQNNRVQAFAIER